MTKKKYNRPKHQKDVSFGDTSEEEFNPVNVQGKSCPHVARGIHFGRVKKSLKSSQSIVTCSGCPNENTDVEEIPEVWLCLQCGYRGCGRSSESKHGLQHFKTLHSDCHSLVLSTTSGSVWCYDCDDEISLQSSRTLKQCVEFVMKMTPNAPNKSNVTTINKFSQQSLRNSVIKEETAAQNPEQNGPVEKAKKFSKNNKEVSEKIPIKGLRNLGNTCFFNAVMQNLNQTTLLYHELKNTCTPSNLWEVPELSITNGEITENENANTFKLSLLRQFPLTNSLFNCLEQMSAISASKVDVINPSPLFGEISKKCPQFRHFQQQDSHELLRQLLDGIRQEEIKRQKKAILRHFDLENINPEEVDEEMKKQIKAYGCYASHTIVEKIFGGLLISTVLCEECKMSSQVFEPFMDLSLPLFEEKQQETNEQLYAMLDGGKQDHIKPLRNRKVDWDCDENVQGEYVLSKPKSDLGKPSKHQEEKQKQLAKKEKRRAKKTTFRNRKNFLNEQDSNSTCNQLPESNDGTANEEENVKECDEDIADNQDEGNWELTALLAPDDENWELTALLAPDEENSKDDPTLTLQTHDPNIQDPVESSDIVAGEKSNETSESPLHIHECNNVQNLEVENKTSKPPLHTHECSNVQNLEVENENPNEGLNSVLQMQDNDTQNHVEVNPIMVGNGSPSDNSECAIKCHDDHNYAQNYIESNLAGEGHFYDPEPALKVHDHTSSNHIELKNLTEIPLAFEDSQVDAYEQNKFNSMTESVKDISVIQSEVATEDNKMNIKKPNDPGRSEVYTEIVLDQTNNIEDEGTEIQNGKVEEEIENVSNLEDSLQGLAEGFSNCLKISDSNQSSIDDRIQALSMQVKDVRIRRDSDRQENLLNSSESADDCDSLKTNCTSPKSSIEETCSIENGDNWSHSVSEQQTKDWISKTLTTLKARHHVSPLECSINSCLSHFTKPELLTGNNKFRCENCTELKIKKTGNKKEVVYSNASKQLLIFSPPAVLTLHLKRFQQVGMSLRKVNRFVEFPLILDLASFCCSACTILPHMSSTEDEILYSLYGIVEHSGRLTSGHYTAYVKANKRTINRTFECQLPLAQCDLQQLLHKFSGATKSSPPNISEQTNENWQWFYISDSHVKEVSEAQVLKCQAYLLFYERIK